LVSGIRLAPCLPGQARQDFAAITVINRLVRAYARVGESPGGGNSPARRVARRLCRPLPYPASANPQSAWKSGILAELTQSQKEAVVTRFCDPIPRKQLHVLLHCLGGV